MRTTLRIVAMSLIALAAPAVSRAVDLGADIALPFGDNNVLCDAGECRYRTPNAYFGQDPSSVFKRLGSSSFGMGGLHLNAYGAFDEVSQWFVPEGATIGTCDGLPEPCLIAERVAIAEEAKE